MCEVVSLQALGAIVASPCHVQAHNDLIKTYEAKLATFGVPTEELGFKPLRSTVAGQDPRPGTCWTGSITIIGTWDSGFVAF